MSKITIPSNMFNKIYEFDKFDEFYLHLLIKQAFGIHVQTVSVVSHCFERTKTFLISF